MNELLNKYKNFITDVDNKISDDYVKVLDTCVNYLKNNDNVDLNLKVAATFVIKELFLNHSNFNTNNIENIINHFINHYNNQYQNYINNLAIITDQFDADISFYRLYINQLKILNN